MTGRMDDLAAHSFSFNEPGGREIHIPRVAHEKLAVSEATMPPIPRGSMKPGIIHSPPLSGRFTDPVPEE